MVPRRICEIACEIHDDWSKRGKGVNYAAKPYLDAMMTLNHIDENYMYDSARSVVMYFLANANSWRGDTARRVKLELKEMLS